MPDSPGSTNDPLLGTMRLAQPGDSPALLQLTAETGFFRPHELDALKEVLDDYHASAQADEGHLSFVQAIGETIDGFVYFAPAPMALGTWSLWWIVVRKTSQSRGLGGMMIRFVEDEIRRRGGRVLFVETSSQSLYEPTRRFYRKLSYEEHAVLKDFYDVADDMIVFRKSMS